MSRLEGVKISTVPNLKSKGITTIGEYLFGSSKVIKTVTKINTDEYTKIREKPSLSSKKSLEDSLDKMIKQAATIKPATRKESTPSPTVKTSSQNFTTRNTAKEDLAKARASLANSKSLDSFTPPAKSIRTVEPKEMGSIKHLSPKGVSSNKTSSKKSSKRSSKR